MKSRLILKVWSRGDLLLYEMSPKMTKRWELLIFLFVVMVGFLICHSTHIVWPIPLLVGGAVHRSKEGKLRLRNGNVKALQAPSKPLLEVNIFLACKGNEAQIRHFGSSAAYKLVPAVFKIISKPWYFSDQGLCKPSRYASRKYLCGVLYQLFLL